jgi:RNA polymerase sigma factor (sigma-70 family)
MTATMKPTDGTSLQTRPSLLQRLGTGDDSRSWQDFYRIYGGLIRHFATKAGLTTEEAEEVVQETAIGVARGLPNYVYDPAKCRFKTWLLNLVKWRIQDQLRKRRPHCNHEQPSDDNTAIIERIADPSVIEFGAEWDAAWEKNLLTQALERVRDRIDDRQYQVFDLNVMKGWSASEVAQTLGISVARDYLTKHRVSALLKKDVSQLEAALSKSNRV